MLLEDFLPHGSAVGFSVPSQPFVLADEASQADDVLLDFCLLWGCRPETLLGSERPSETLPNLFLQADTQCFNGESN